MSLENEILNLSQSNDSWRRSFGRLMATEASDAFGKWFIAEMERGSSPPDVLIATSSLVAFMLSFAVKNTARSGHEREAIALIIRDLEKNILNFVESAK